MAEINYREPDDLNKSALEITNARTNPSYRQSLDPFQEGQRIDTMAQSFSTMKDHSAQARAIAKLGNAYSFSEMFNIPKDEAFRYHDAIVRGVYPGAKQSPESTMENMMNIFVESKKMEELRYLDGLVFLGADNPDIVTEQQRLLKETRDGMALSEAYGEMSELARTKFKQNLLDTTAQAPQLLGKIKEILNAGEHAESRGLYFQEIQPETLVGKMIKTTLETGLRPFTAGMRYSYITHSGDMSSEIAKTFIEEGIEPTENQEKQINQVIRTTGNIYSVLNGLGLAADVALTGVGATGAGMAVRGVLKGAAKHAAASVLAYGGNILESGVSEGLQTLTTEIGMHTVEGIVGLHEQGIITVGDKDKMIAGVREAASMARQVTALTGGVGVVGGLTVGLGYRVRKDKQNFQAMKETVVKMQKKETLASINKAFVAAAVMNDVTGDGPAPIKVDMREIWNDNGALNVEGLRKVNQKLQQEMVKFKVGEGDKAIYTAARAIQSLVIKEQNISRPSGVYSNLESTYIDHSDGDYQGRITVDFGEDADGPHLMVEYNGGSRNHSSGKVRYSIDQDERAGVSVSQVTDSYYGSSHEVSIRMDKAVEEFKIGYLKEGEDFDIEVLASSFDEETGNALRLLHANLNNAMPFLRQVPINEQQTNFEGQEALKGAKIDTQRETMETPDSYPTPPTAPEPALEPEIGQLADPNVRVVEQELKTVMDMDIYGDYLLTDEERAAELIRARAWMKENPKWSVPYNAENERRREAQNYQIKRVKKGGWYDHDLDWYEEKTAGMEEAIQYEIDSGNLTDRKDILKKVYDEITYKKELDDLNTEHIIANAEAGEKNLLDAYRNSVRADDPKGQYTVPIVRTDEELDAQQVDATEPNVEVFTREELDEQSEQLTHAELIQFELDEIERKYRSKGYDPTEREMQEAVDDLDPEKVSGVELIRNEAETRERWANAQENADLRAEEDAAYNQKVFEEELKEEARAPIVAAAETEAATMTNEEMIEAIKATGKTMVEAPPADMSDAEFRTLLEEAYVEAKTAEFDTWFDKDLQEQKDLGVEQRYDDAPVETQTEPQTQEPYFDPNGPDVDQDTGKIVIGAVNTLFELESDPEIKYLPKDIKAKLDQMSYLIHMSQSYHNASEYAGDVIGEKIRTTLYNSKIPEPVKASMDKTLRRAGVYTATPEELKAYQELPADKANWSDEQRRLATLVEMKDFDSISAEELGSLYDVIKVQAQSGLHILDVEFNGDILRPELVVDLAIDEIQKRRAKNGSAPLDEQFEDSVRDTLMDKVGQVEILAFSMDNFVQSLAGDGVFYDVVLRNLVQAGREAERLAVNLMEEYNRDVTIALASVVDGLDPDKAVKYLQKWKYGKTKIDGVTFTNNELLAIYMHSTSKENITHLKHGIKKQTKKGGQVLIPPEVVQSAINFTKMDPKFAAIGESMRASLETIRLMQEDVLRKLMGDPTLEHGYSRNYFPIHVADFDPKWFPTDEYGRERISTNKTMLMQRLSKPDALLVLDGGLDSFQSAIQKGSRFVYQESGFWRASRIVKDPKFENSVKNATSKAHYDALWKGLEDMAGLNDPWADAGFSGNLMRKLMVARSIGALGFNPISAMRAWASVFGTAAFVDPDIATKVVTMMKNPAGQTPREFASGLSLLHRARVNGGLYPEFMNGQVIDNATWLGKKVKDASFWMMKQFDADASARAFMGGYMQAMKDIENGVVSEATSHASGITVAAMNKLDQEGKVRLAIQVGDDVMNRSQPSYEAAARSALQRNGIMGAMLTQFGSSVGQMRQQVVTAGLIMKNEMLTPEQKAQKISLIATALGLQTVSYVAIGLLGKLAYGELDKDDEIGKIAAVGFLNAAGSTFGIGRMVSLRLSDRGKADAEATGKKTKITIGIDFVPIPSLDGDDSVQFLNALTKITKSMGGKETDKGELLDAYVEMMTYIGQGIAMGTPIGAIPRNQIKKGIEATQNWTNNGDDE